MYKGERKKPVFYGPYLPTIKKRVNRSNKDIFTLLIIILSAGLHDILRGDVLQIVDQTLSLTSTCYTSIFFFYVMEKYLIE